MTDSVRRQSIPNARVQYSIERLLEVQRCDEQWDVEFIAFLSQQSSRKEVIVTTNVRSETSLVMGLRCY